MIILNDCIKEAFFAFIDIRGFTKWSLNNQLEIRKLLNILYTCGIEYFGERREQTYLKRIVKYLGDGFFAVNEYDQNDDNDLIESMNQVVSSSCTLIKEFRKRIIQSPLHDKAQIGIGIGISYGPALRFNLQGQPIDYSGKVVNTASRLCSVASDCEIVMESEIEKFNIMKKLKLPDDFSYSLQEKEPKKMEKLMTFCIKLESENNNQVLNPDLKNIVNSMSNLSNNLKHQYLPKDKTF